MNGTRYLDFSSNKKVIKDFYKIAIFDQCSNVKDDGSIEFCECKFMDVTDQVDEVEVIPYQNEVLSGIDVEYKFAYKVVGYKDGNICNLIPEGKIANKIAFEKVWCDNQIRFMYSIYLIDENVK